MDLNSLFDLISRLRCMTGLVYLFQLYQSDFSLRVFATIGTESHLQICPALEKSLELVTSLFSYILAIRNSPALEKSLKLVTSLFSYILAIGKHQGIV
jgi:hypothetical protein